MVKMFEHVDLFASEVLLKMLSKHWQIEHN